MANSVSQFYWNNRVQACEPRILEILVNISNTTTGDDVYHSPFYGGFNSAEFGVGSFSSAAGSQVTQALIDSFLGTTNEFLLAAFDATSMGTGAFGGVINMGGQVQEVLYMKARSSSGTGGVTQVNLMVQDSSSLTSSSLSTQVAKGANGNIGFRAILTGVDSVSSGQMLFEIAYYSK